MLDGVWLRLTRLSSRLEKFWVVSCSAAFFMAWVSLGTQATRHWHTMPTDSHLWVVLILWFSLFLWIALLRGKTKRSTSIACLAMMLMAVGLLWFQHLR
jgi:divalent metal cation (Fe/Co/Zn/Cd) transporter